MFRYSKPVVWGTRGLHPSSRGFRCFRGLRDPTGARCSVVSKGVFCEGGGDLNNWGGRAHRLQ